MSTADIVNISNEKVGEIELNAQVFDLEVKEHLLHDFVRMQRAAKRSGNACTKSRVEVRGGGAKPWRQKGTGRARAGTRNSPIWRGGGVAFGPKPRDYTFKLNRKVKKQALAMAMSARLKEGNLVILDDFVMNTIKTKDFVGIMKGFEFDNCLIITDGLNDIVSKSARNVNGFKILPSEGLNVYDILLHKKLILVRPVVESLEERLMP
ncbi:MAG: 50S ribosomal protein L4 [Proteobacteria bacterium]|nr:50S ribosomal protein L4 [Pseudomonadota bacterium]MBU1140012.1 50S ribosomal protein L4 [Pseudomonadota bacterium]MBU1232303.1 50S ribosomal protein L4 [Pseudomonadota bacterium]MBU1419365.1 50S ribosomal protein L4 [Pseudomonadota bacterium]MBU1454205.1 50S ribosomal protein L4 [Pseudomonadota bacterium]